MKEPHGYGHDPETGCGLMVIAAICMAIILIVALIVVIILASQ